MTVTRDEKTLLILKHVKSYYPQFEREIKAENMHEVVYGTTVVSEAILLHPQHTLRALAEGKPIDVSYGEKKVFLSEVKYQGEVIGWSGVSRISNRVYYYLWGENDGM
jgi:hypothetical protein